MPVSASRSNVVGARRPASRASRRSRGYALLVVLLLFSMLALSLAVAVPQWTTEIRREHEQAEIDYAREYVMGIRRYYHKYGTYPPNLDRLTESDNEHYLRRAWPDPLNPGGKWRFLHAGDVQVPKPPGSPQGTGLEDLMQLGAGAGSTAQPDAGAAGASGANAGASSGAALGASPQTPSGSLLAPGGSPLTSVGSPGVATPGSGSSMGSPLPPGGALGGTPLTGAAPGSPAAAAGGLGLPGLNLGPLLPPDGDIVGYLVLTPAAAARTDNDEVVGAPIIGVASRKAQLAVHEFNGHDRPSDWLFVYDPTADRRGGLNGAIPQHQPPVGLGGAGSGAGATPNPSPGTTPNPPGPGAGSGQ